MSPTFVILALITLGGAAAAMRLRNLVHCALCVVVSFTGLAGLYLQLGAQFVGLAQVLVYVGAVAVLIVFAILLTRGGDTGAEPRVAGKWLVGIGIAGLVLGSIAAAVLGSTALGRGVAEPPSVTVREVGTRLMTEYVLPLEVIALLLTAALIGAVMIAMQERPSR